MVRLTPGIPALTFYPNKVFSCLDGKVATKEYQFVPADYTVLDKIGMAVGYTNTLKPAPGPTASLNAKL